MSIKLMSLIWDRGPANQTERFVLLALADFASDEGECWPSVPTVARKTCMTDRSVQRIVRSLEAQGWLRVDLSSAKRGCNRYTITIPDAENPRHSVTPDTVSPPTQCHPTGDTVSPPPRHSVTRTIIDPSLNQRDTSSLRSDVSIPPQAQKPKRGTRLPDDWTLPDDMRSWAVTEGGLSAAAVAVEAEKFRDYWCAKSGRDAVKLDWAATWRNWCRTAASRIRPNGYAPSAPSLRIVARLPEGFK